MSEVTNDPFGMVGDLAMRRVEIEMTEQTSRGCVFRSRGAMARAHDGACRTSQRPKDSAGDPETAQASVENCSRITGWTRGVPNPAISLTRVTR